MKPQGMLAAIAALIFIAGAVVAMLDSAILKIASISATPLPSQQRYPSILSVMEVAPWTFNCLATSTLSLFAASRAPRTADTLASGSWLLATNMLQSLPVSHAIPHVENITRRQMLG